MKKLYDTIVVGGGHAGSEAAYISSKMGGKTLLITMNLQNIAQMSCNPAMGGVAKGQIIREIDALGGRSAFVSDLSAVQFKMLNRSKGPAMWSPRAQSDRMLFSAVWRKELEKQKNLDFCQAMVSDLLIDNNKISGVVTSTGTNLYAKTVILTNGTFLNGLIHIGEKNYGGGRTGEQASFGITKSLERVGFSSGRMKTGTPPRVDGRSLDFSIMEPQPGDTNPEKFSFSDDTQPLKKQLDCFLTYTNKTSHDILRSGFDRSPMFNGSIKSIGPRYCPSIEDKINRFSEKDRHQIFVEPEGWDTIEYYINGFSTSLPEEIQVKALKKIKGFKNAKVIRPGYAVEYDYFPPTQLKKSMETKIIPGLFFAGQINGTTGYEEAAAQGLMAGINANLHVNCKEPIVLSRSDAYIGVLIDDLVTKGTEEPYRMFTSRAEFRTLLRQDNADLRLSEKAYSLGLIGSKRINKLISKKQAIDKLLSFYKKTSISPKESKSVLKEKDSPNLKQSQKISKLYSRPNIFFKDLLKATKISDFINREKFDKEVISQAEIQIKYSGYIEKELKNVEKINRLENLRIPSGFDFNSLKSISNEAKEKLIQISPTTLAQASRISGVSPSDISSILVKIGR
ncbi:tRNA uridine-5-carboxymethylaminomethyl(34) synthesis enzyme MnmG [Bacteroidota bacterium]|nr:tRNA uridine-5-carboxymethylaminomethyl(34) synthesis enzyme MnmG [Bacteroidota bacterium]